MTTPNIAFGPTLAFAERTLTAVLRQHLAERQTAPETWYALQLINMHGPKLAREALHRDLAGSRGMNADLASDLLTRLEAEGLISGGTEIDFTAEGEALFRSLREYVTAPTAQLLSQFDANDIDTTIRTIQAITKRAAEGLAS